MASSFIFTFVHNNKVILEIFYMIIVYIISITLFSFILYDRKFIQNSTYIKGRIKGIEKEYKDKFIVIENKKIIRLNDRIEKLIKVIVQDSKNISNVVIKFSLKIAI